MSAPPAGIHSPAMTAARSRLQHRSVELRQRYLLGVVRLNTANRTRQFGSRTRTEETAMSNQLQEDVVPGPEVKTLAVWLNPEMHAQLSIIAQLRGNNLAHEIRVAITAHIEAMKTHPLVMSRAEDALKDIEVEAAERRRTIATLFGEEAPTLGSNPAKSGRSRARKSTESPDGQGGDLDNPA